MSDSLARNRSDEVWFLTRRGSIPRISRVLNGRKIKVWLVTRCHKDAKRLVKWLANKDGITGLSPALLGSVQGETLSEHIRLAIKDGCAAALWVSGWDDGEPVGTYTALKG